MSRVCSFIIVALTGRAFYISKCHQRFLLEPFFALLFSPCPQVYSVVNRIATIGMASPTCLIFPAFHFTFFCLLFISHVFLPPFLTNHKTLPPHAPFVNETSNMSILSSETRKNNPPNDLFYFDS